MPKSLRNKKTIYPTLSRNTHVGKLTNLFEDPFIDPFNLDEPPPHLVNIATGMVATTAVEGSLTGALQKGAEMESKICQGMACQRRG